MQNSHHTTNHTRRNFQRVMQTTAALLSLAAVNLPARANPGADTQRDVVQHGAGMDSAQGIQGHKPATLRRQ